MQSFETAYCVSPLRGSAVESKGMAISLEKSRVPSKMYSDIPKMSGIHQMIVSQQFKFQTKMQSDKVRIIQPQRAQSTQRGVLIDPACYSILKEHHIEIN